MNKRSLYLIAFIPLFAYAEIYLEYGKSWGRFGDNLLSYMHTKYVSHITGIPVLYTPFIYSDQLKLSQNEISSKKNNIKKIKITRDNFTGDFNDLINKKSCTIKEDLIVEIPYFPGEHEYHLFKSIDKTWIFFDVDWNNLEFKKALKQNISPLYHLNLIKIPAHKISIAMHFREGGGFDAETAQAFNPSKFPPLEYYVQALKEMLSLLKKENDFYIYIFTDHQLPEKLVSFFRKKFPQKNIQFDCRIHNNRHDQNVLEDFFSLTLFDCLIRPQSNFSLTAAKIADYLIEIEPTEFKVDGEHIAVTKINVISKI